MHVRQISAADRGAVLDREHARARSGAYPAPPADPDADDLALMRRIDAVFVARPSHGSRRIAVTLRAEGEAANRKRVRLMREMGIAALRPKPRTSKPGPGHKIFPYLLRDVAVERANQAWCADITYIPMRCGFL